MISKFNKVTFDIDISEFEYVKVKDVEDKVYQIDGLFINSSQFGQQALAILANEKKLVNLPLHLTPIVQEILNDYETVQAIKEGRCGIKRRQYHKNNNEYYTIVFVDIEK